MNEAFADEFSQYLAGVVLCGCPENAVVLPVMIFAEVLMGVSTIEQAEVKFRHLFHCLSTDVPYGVDRYAYSRLIALCRARARTLAN